MTLLTLGVYVEVFPSPKTYNDLGVTDLVIDSVSFQNYM